MKTHSAIVLTAVAASLGSTGIAGSSGTRDILWLDICGKPGMRVAIALDRDEGTPEHGDCAKACHAVTCRKGTAGETRSGATGARI